MITLAIEASNPNVPNPAIAVGEAGRVLAVEPLRVVARHEDDLVAAVARAMARAGKGPREIGLVAVSIGPGGYTSLRMACAAGQMIALVAGCPCAPVPTALVGLLSVGGQGGALGRRVGVALAGKHDAAFVTVYEGEGDPAPTPGRLVAASEIAGLGLDLLVGGEHTPAALVEAARGAGVRMLPLVLQAESLLAAAGMVPPVEPARCVPLYGREPEAVSKWRALHGSPTDRT